MMCAGPCSIAERLAQNTEVAQQACSRLTYFIHRSAWKVYSPNFAFTEFAEGVLGSTRCHPAPDVMRLPPCGLRVLNPSYRSTAG
jgi:hypothetical protein